LQRGRFTRAELTYSYRAPGEPVVHTYTTIAHLGNPSTEDDSEHYYAPEMAVLDRLGYQPSATVQEVFERTRAVIQEYIDRIDVDALAPDVSWTRRDAQVVRRADDD